MDNNSSNENDEQVPKKPTLTILEEVDKEMIHDLPPNFNSFNYTRVHDRSEGTLNE